MKNAFEPIARWRFNVADEEWSIRGEGDFAYVQSRRNGQYNTQVVGEINLVDGLWVMKKHDRDCIERHRDPGTAAAILAYLTEHGVPWKQSSWSSTPPMSGDMYAKHRGHIALYTNGRQSHLWGASEPSALEKTQYWPREHFLKMAATQGWQFRPLTSAESS